MYFPHRANVALILPPVSVSMLLPHCVPRMRAFFRSSHRSVPPFHYPLFPPSLPVQPSSTSSICSFFPPLTPCLFILGDHFVSLSRPLNVCLALMHTFSRSSFFLSVCVSICMSLCLSLRFVFSVNASTMPINYNALIRKCS